MNTESPPLQLKSISKSFGRTLALNNVDLQVNRGEVIGLLGDNGAGKSTLVKIIAGASKPDSGEIIVHGVKQRRWTPRIARAAGFETVYQDKALAENQTIAQNVFMGRELTNRLGFIRVKEQTDTANQVMREIGFTSRQFDANSQVFGLSGGERQGVAIGRALHFRADLVLLDEPTNALAIREVSEVLQFIDEIRQRGSSALFISHNVHHSYEVSDRLILLDRGEIVGEFRRSELTLDELLARMHDLSLKGRLL